MTDPTTVSAAVPYLHLLDRVEFEPSEWPVAGSTRIQPIWKGVDRPEGVGVSLRPEMATDAARLRDVILRGDAYEAVTVATDVNGRTYMSAFPRFAVMELGEDLDTLDRIGPRAGADVPA